MISILNEYLEKAYECDENEYPNIVKYFSQAWKLTRNMIEREGIKILEDFDSKYDSCTFLSDWIQDYQMNLELIYFETKEKIYLENMIKFIDEVFDTIDLTNEVDIKHTFIKSKAESLYLLGKESEAEKIIQKELDIDEKWGFGYIAMADYYYENKNTDKSIEILLKASNIKDLEDLDIVALRIENIVDSLNKNDTRRKSLKSVVANIYHIEKVRRNEMYRNNKDIINLLSNSNLNSKTGRNDSCFCGSGKKYKHCCLNK